MKLKILKEYLIAFLLNPLLTVIIMLLPMGWNVWPVMLVVTFVAYGIYMVITEKKLTRKIQDRYMPPRKVLRSMSRMEALCREHRDVELYDECRHLHHVMICVIIMWLISPGLSVAVSIALDMILH